MHAALLLAIETSGPRGGVALARGETLLVERGFSADRRQSAELAPLIRDVVAAAGASLQDIGVVCFSGGPGSFTGLRIAATTCAMLQSTLGCRVVRAPTLEVLARNALADDAVPDGARVAPMIPVRRDEVAAGAYVVERRASAGAALDALREAASAALWRPEALLATLPPGAVVLGEGVRPHLAAFEAAGMIALREELWFPRASEVLAVGRALAEAGRFCLPEEIVPIYARPPECEEVYEQRRAEAVRRRAEAERRARR